VKTVTFLGAMAVAYLFGFGTNACLAQTGTTLEGVRNYTHVSTTIGCAGATAPEALAELKEMGYASVINLRLADENGVDIEASRAAAAGAGLKYIHLPFNLSRDDREATVDRFLQEVTREDNLPAFIHCGSANRVGGLWLTKRMLVDGWDAAKATEEAEKIGLRSAEIRQFALDYVAAHRH
jgi:protein tyrosine phosphatase (PTP) superfamily phosphohydrolase (DUF442 family)